jgi:uncharacterized membrane protein YfcA
MSWRFLVMIVAGTFSGTIVQQDIATGFSMHSVAVLVLSALLVLMLLVRRRPAPDDRRKTSRR